MKTRNAVTLISLLLAGCPQLEPEIPAPPKPIERVSLSIPGTATDIPDAADQIKQAEKVRDNSLLKIIGETQEIQPASPELDDKTPGKAGPCGRRIAVVGDSYAVHFLAKYLRLDEFCGRGTLIRDRDSDDDTLLTTNGTDLYGAMSRRSGVSKSYFPQMLDDFIHADDPGTILLFTGNNDVINDRVCSKNIGTNIDYMISKAHAKGAKIVVATIPPFRNAEFRKEYHVGDVFYGDIIVKNILGANTRIKASKADSIVDLHALLEDPAQKNAANPKLYNRGLHHPTKSTFQNVIARDFYRALKRLYSQD